MKRSLLFILIVTLVSGLSSAVYAQSEVANADLQRKELMAVLDGFKLRAKNNDKHTDKDIKALQKEYDEFVASMASLISGAERNPNLWKEAYNRSKPWMYVVNDIKRLGLPIMGKKEVFEPKLIDYTNLASETGSKYADEEMKVAKSKMAMATIEDQDGCFYFVKSAQRVSPERKEEFDRVAADFLFTRASAAADNSDFNAWEQGIKDYREINKWIDDYNGCKAKRAELSEKLQNALWANSSQNILKEDLASQVLAHEQLTTLERLNRDYKGGLTALRKVKSNLSLYVLFVDETGKLIVPKMTKDNIESLSADYFVKLLNPGTVEAFKDITVTSNSAYAAIAENLGGGFAAVKMNQDGSYTLVDARNPSSPVEAGSISASAAKTNMEDDVNKHTSDIVAALKKIKYTFPR